MPPRLRRPRTALILLLIPAISWGGHPAKSEIHNPNSAITAQALTHRGLAFRSLAQSRFFTAAGLLSLAALAHLYGHDAASVLAAGLVVPGLRFTLTGRRPDGRFVDYPDVETALREEADPDGLLRRYLRPYAIGMHGKLGEIPEHDLIMTEPRIPLPKEFKDLEELDEASIRDQIAFSYSPRLRKMRLFLPKWLKVLKEIIEIVPGNPDYAFTLLARHHNAHAQHEVGHVVDEEGAIVVVDAEAEASLAGIEALPLFQRLPATALEEVQGMKHDHRADVYRLQRFRPLDRDTFAHIFFDPLRRGATFTHPSDLVRLGARIGLWRMDGLDAYVETALKRHEKRLVPLWVDQWQLLNAMGEYFTLYPVARAYRSEWTQKYGVTVAPPPAPYWLPRSAG